MSSNARKKRASLSDAKLLSEMKIWRRNKLEERKLSLQNDLVDKHKAVRRKSYVQAQVSLNKDFDEMFSKKTPSADEYLEKSQAKYATWKEREREKLDRKYRSLHKSYLNEYNKLGIKHFGPQSTRRHSTPETSTTTDETTESKTDILLPDEKPMSEEEAMLALGKLNLDISRRRFSDLNVSGKYPTSRRRGSTGSIDLAEFAKLRSLHLALTTVSEDTNTYEESEDDVKQEADDNVEKLDDITTRRKSVTIKEEPDEDIQVEDLIFKPKRRASIATMPRLPVKDSPIPLGKRFDRRPTLPNIAIPFNYGN